MRFACFPKPCSSCWWFVGIRCSGVFSILAYFLPNRALLCKLLRPDNVQGNLSADLCAAGHFKAAEDLCRRGLIALLDSVRLLTGLATALVFPGRRRRTCRIRQGTLVSSRRTHSPVEPTANCVRCGTPSADNSSERRRSRNLRGSGPVQPAIVFGSSGLA